MEQKRKWMLELKRLIVESLAARVPMRVSCAVALPIQLWSSLVCKFPEEHGKSVFIGGLKSVLKTLLARASYSIFTRKNVEFIFAFASPLLHPCTCVETVFTVK